MKLAKIFTLGALLIFVLALNAGGVFKNEPAQSDQQNTKTLSSSQRIMMMHSMANVNNIESGEKIKKHLHSQENITLIFHNKKDTSHYYDHEAAVDFITEPSADELDEMTRDIKGWVVKHLNSVYIFRSTSMETPQMVEYFNERPNVEYAEPNFILMQNEVSSPNDLLYQENYQWNLPAIGTEEGWNITRGKEQIEIAIVDTGVDLDHPELRNRIVAGYNVIDENQEPDDDNGHGTHVAGIIASETNNREGVAGITWFSKIIPVKAMGAKGYGTTFDIAKGIIWAVDHGADVINLSLGNYQPSKVLEEAVRYAYDQNVVMVSAAGNDGSNQPTYPSSYPEVLSVAAVDYNGNRASFSNYGDYIDIAAPGVNIPSTFFHSQYAALSGTSMAAPHVAGLAALIKSVNPDLKNSQIITIIKNSAIDLGEQGKDIDYGNGLIDVNSALQEASKKQTPKRTRQRSLFNWLS